MRDGRDDALFKNPDYPPGCTSREIAELGNISELDSPTENDRWRLRIAADDCVEEET